MAFRFVSSDVCEVTAELALEVAALDAVPGERPLSQARLTHLEREIKRGTTIAFRWVTADCNGKRYRVNGQHTSYLFGSGDVEPSGVVTLEHYECDSIGDVRTLWSMFDASYSSRTSRDVLATEVASHPSLVNCSPRVIRLAASAVVTVKHGDDSRFRLSHLDRAKSAGREHQFIRWVCDLIAGYGYDWTSVDTRHAYVERKGVVVAIFAQWREDPESTARFWGEVIKGDNPNPESPTRKLQLFLLQHGVRAGGGTARTAKRMLDWDAFAEVSMAAWYAWLRGETIKRLVVTSRGVERFIKIGK